MSRLHIGFSIIPNAVKYDANIKTLSKFILSDILSFQYQDQCFASNKYFADLYQVSIRTIEGAIKELRDKGYIETEYEPRTNKRLILPSQSIWREYDFIRNMNNESKKPSKQQTNEKPKDIKIRKNNLMEDLPALWTR